MADPERRGRPRGPLHVLGDALYGVLRFIARHAHGAYTAVLTYLSVAFFVALAGVWAFIVLADEVLAGSTLRLDEAVLSWVAAHRTETLDRVALEVTALGNYATLVVLVLAVSVFLWLTRHRLSVLLLIVALTGSGILNTLLKELFGRPRPTVVEAITLVSSESFPSGHSMTAFVAYASVAYLGGRLEPTRALRWSTWGLATLLILAIGASRVYLGVHYPSDVLGGYAAGLAWLGFVVSGLAAIRYLAGRKHPVERAEQDLHAEEERNAGLRE